VDFGYFYDGTAEACHEYHAAGLVLAHGSSRPRHDPSSETTFWKNLSLVMTRIDDNNPDMANGIAV